MIIDKFCNSIKMTSNSKLMTQKNSQNTEIRKTSSPKIIISRYETHCGCYFIAVKNEISFWVINILLTLPQNAIIRKETFAHANISLKLR